MLCPILSFFVVLCCVVSCCVVLCCVVLCRVVLCFVVLCYVMSCHVMSCDIKLCIVIIFSRSTASSNLQRYHSIMFAECILCLIPCCVLCTDLY